jgi:hypothetical protein
MRFRFLRSIFVMSAILAVVLAYPVHAWMSEQVVRAVAASGIIAVANVVAGCFLLEYAIDKPTSLFMIAVLGGMGVRMGIILVVLLVLLLNGYDALSLSLSLMGFYVAFMVAEFTFVLMELSRRPVRTSGSRQARRELLTFRTSFNSL